MSLADRIPTTFTILPARRLDVLTCTWVLAASARLSGAVLRLRVVHLVSGGFGEAAPSEAFDEVQDGGDPRCHAAGGDDVAGVDPADGVIRGIGSDASGELGGVFEVGGEGASVEQAGGAEDERAGADRHDHRAAVGVVPGGAGQYGVCQGAVDVDGAGDDENVDVLEVGQRVSGVSRKPP